MKGLNDRSQTRVATATNKEGLRHQEPGAHDLRDIVELVPANQDTAWNKIVRETFSKPAPDWPRPLRCLVSYDHPPQARGHRSAML